MTGKELIMYILQNNLENEKTNGLTLENLEDCFFTGFMTEKEAAVKFNVGVETIKAWYDCKMLSGTKIGDSLYFRKDATDPRISIKMNTNKV